MSTFVSVGNATQPFDRLLGAIRANLERLPAPVVIQAGNATFDCRGADSRTFVAMDEFERLMTGARLVVMHAGAGSVIHAVRAGKVPVVMPRRSGYGEHVDDHQLEFARQLALEGLIVLAEEPEDLRDAVVAAMNLQQPGKSRSQGAVMLQFVNEVLAGYAASGKR